MSKNPSQTIAYTIRDSLYLNITDRCTLRCTFCPKYNGTWKVHDYNLQLQHRPVISDIIDAIGDPSKYQEVVFCGYGEPTLRLQPLLEIAEYIKQHDGRVRVNTDGLGNLVHKRNILPELVGKVDALSVSMNAQSANVYQQHCKPTLQGSYPVMLTFLSEAPKYIDDVTATAINGLEGVDIRQCEGLARNMGVKFRQREIGIVG